MVSIWIPGKKRTNRTKEACLDAARAAQEYMGRLFSGQVSVLCECGREVRYANNRLQCSDCGRDLNAVAYIQKYGDLYIQTTVFVEHKRFRLSVGDSPDCFDDE